VPDAVKRLCLQAGLDGTVVTTQVDGAPLRVLRTTLIDQLEEGEAVTAANTPVLLRAAMMDGRTDLGADAVGAGRRADRGDRAGG
jgi:NAD(P)H-dependent flavin oxidoreductase YrpB (nitropropane dioxygenase family)